MSASDIPANSHTGSRAAGATGAAPARWTPGGRGGVVADRVGGQELHRLATAVRYVGATAEARRQNPSEGAAAGIHSGLLLIAGGMESGDGRRAVFNFAHELLVFCFWYPSKIPDRNRRIRTWRTVS